MNFTLSLFDIMLLGLHIFDTFVLNITKTSENPLSHLNHLN